MFKKFWLKREPSISVNNPLLATTLNWLSPLLDDKGSLSKPNWPAIEEYIERHSMAEQKRPTWNEVARAWMASLTHKLPHEYTQTESANFILISAEPARYNVSLCTFLERARRRLLSTAGAIFQDNVTGKYVIIVFADIDSYYDYVSQFGSEEGTFGLSSGMYINYGYGHFVFQQDQLETAEVIAAHELTHALLEHLPIPHWLNEGLAVNMEALITGHANNRLTSSSIGSHTEFWQHNVIQQFWNGDAFFRSDEGQNLSYQLAQLLVSNLSKDYDLFVEFVNRAHHKDAGDSALQNTYGISLNELTASFLGDGSWAPQAKNGTH